MNYRQLITYSCGILLLLSSCKSVNQETASIQAAKIQTTLDSLVQIGEIPGINFSYINSDNQQHNFSSGYENVSTKTELTSSHTMFSGSVGKTYVAAIILQLVEENKIKYDNNILTYLPQHEWLQQIPNIEDITVRMLLNNTSGLPAYSDTNYLLLGYLIEHVLKEDYYKVLEERVLTPHQLNNTFPSLSRKIERLASGYSEMPASFHVPHEVLDSEGNYVFNPQFEWTGGGLASTTADLARWADVYYRSDFISDKLREDMIQIQETGKNVYDEIHSYGMGTFIYTTKHGDAYGHSGFMPGYNTIMAYFPDLDLSCAIQINCDYASRELKLTEYLEICVEAMEG